MRKLIIPFVLGIVLVVFGQAAEPAHANCCLCMCHSRDETKCSHMCVRLQHSKKIVEEPAMKKCTTECKRVRVEVVK